MHLTCCCRQNSSLHTRTFIPSHFDRKKLLADLFIGDIDASDGVIFFSGFQKFYVGFYVGFALFVLETFLLAFSLTSSNK